MFEDSERLFNQALYNLQHCDLDLNNGFNEWACLSAQKVAELAIKALFSFKNMDWRSHLIGKKRHQPKGLLEVLVREYNFSVPSEILQSADELLVLRYVNEWGIETGCEIAAQTTFGDTPSTGRRTPHEIVSPEEAERKVEAARKIISWVQSLIF